MEGQRRLWFVRKRREPEKLDVVASSSPSSSPEQWVCDPTSGGRVSLSIYTHTRACTHRRVNIILETLFSQRTTFNPSFLDEPFCVCAASLWLFVCGWISLFYEIEFFLLLRLGHWRRRVRRKTSGDEEKKKKWLANMAVCIYILVVARLPRDCPRGFH